MDAIADELKSMGGLQYHEQKWLEAGQTTECLQSVCKRARRWMNFSVWLFLGMLAVPVVLGLAGLVMERGSGPHPPWQIGILPALTVVPQLLFLSNRLTRLETLSLLWRFSEADVKPVSRAA